MNIIKRIIFRNIAHSYDVVNINCTVVKSYPHLLNNRTTNVKRQLIMCYILLHFVYYVVSAVSSHVWLYLHSKLV